MSIAPTLRHELARVGSGRVSRARSARPDFADVARENLDGIVRYLSHMVGDRDLAEDLTSATFERALRDWHRYDPGRARVTVWLVEIARRVALDHFRSEARRRAREERYASQHPEGVADPEPGGLSDPMRAALAGLSAAERELLALRVVLDLDAGEAARVVGSTRAAVGAGLHRALTKLRKEVVRP